MRRATKIRIYPDKEQARFLDRQFGAVRFVFNKALATAALLQGRRRQADRQA